MILTVVLRSRAVWPATNRCGFVIAVSDEIAMEYSDLT